MQALMLMHVLSLSLSLSLSPPPPPPSLSPHLSVCVCWGEEHSCSIVWRTKCFETDFEAQECNCKSDICLGGVY